MASAAVSILLLTCGLALSKPRIGEIRIEKGMAGILGALLTILVGGISYPQLGQTLVFLFRPVATIVGLMALTLIAEQSGLFRRLAFWMAKSAGGSGTRLFTYIFILGTCTGTVFTNDTTVLIFTPLVWRLIEDVKDDSWTDKSKIPFYFAVLYVANLVGALVISNPINIVIANLFSISFFGYARWMFLPAVFSMIVTYAGLRFFFRGQLPKSYSMEKLKSSPDEPGAIKAQKISAVVLGFILIGFSLANRFEIPFWVIAVSGAVIAGLATYPTKAISYPRVVKGIGWDVLVFMVGMFVIAVGLRNAGLMAVLQRALIGLGGESLHGLSVAVAFLSGAMSSIINNHPTIDIMGLTIQDMTFAAGSAMRTKKILAMSALIGGDLGPKMLPIGSLAAMLWFRLLADKGVVIPYRQYIKIGIPVTLAAILVSVVVLLIEVKFANFM